MIFKQLNRVRIAYRFLRFSDTLRLQKVRDAYPTRLATLEEEIQAGMKELEPMR